MYFVVKLKDSADKKVVPLKWIQHLNMAQLWNYGLTVLKRKIFKVFISHNMSEEPDFQLAVQTFPYNGNRTACYMATVIASFCKYFLPNRLNS